MVDGEAPPHDLGTVVVALPQARAVLVAHAWPPRRIVLDVVHTAAAALPPAADPRLDHVVGGVDEEHRGQLEGVRGKCVREPVRLGEGAWEAVEQQRAAWVAGDPLHDHAHHELVRDEPAVGHVFGRLAAERRPVRAMLPKQVTGGDVRHP